MAVNVNLTNRQQHILWATVRHYITTAEPVGSKTLVEEFNLSASPATIRNAMNFLERVGLLYQPHTSAGRIPSDSGYRIYVDQLITPANELALQVDQVLTDRLNWERWSFEALLRGAAQLLATLSGYIALITMPQNPTTYVRHLQLLQIEPGRVMLILVTDTYETQSSVMELAPADGSEFDAELVDRELQILSNFLNEQLRGKLLAELASLNWQDLDREFQRYAESLQVILEDVTRRSQSRASTQIFVSGVSEILRRQPEFAELTQLQPILHLLEEEQDQICSLIFENADSEHMGRRVMVRIGAENPLEPMRTCALISSTYTKGSIPVGSVGVLGPTRMMYENAIAVVEATADYLSEAIS
jgi:heat-inducible transcriptional repressor